MDIFQTKFNVSNDDNCAYIQKCERTYKIYLKWSQLFDIKKLCTYFETTCIEEIDILTHDPIQKKQLTLSLWVTNEVDKNEIDLIEKQVDISSLLMYILNIS